MLSTIIEEIIANGNEIAIVFCAKSFPKSLTVKSVKTITNGNINAARVIFILRNSNGIETKKFDSVIMKI